METTDRLLSEFIDAWNAGKRPRVDDFVERAPAAERDELAGLIGAFLEVAPAPAHTPEQLAEIRRDPTVQAVTGLLDSPGGLWPALLPRLRKQAKLSRDEVVARVIGILGLEGREAKVKRYYHEMETGTIEPAGVSRKVLDALARVLGADVDKIEEAGERGVLGPAPATEMHLRLMAPNVEVDAIHAERLEHVAERSPAADEEWDEVDRLFRGGR
jgi:hypothetical protein